MVKPPLFWPVVEMIPFFVGSGAEENPPKTRLRMVVKGDAAVQ